MIYENTDNINEAFNRNGQSAAFCDRFLHFSHKTTLCCLIKDYHIRTINIMVQAATFFTHGIAMVVVVFVAFYVATLDGSIFGVMHTPAAPKFELFLRTSCAQFLVCIHHTRPRRVRIVIDVRTCQKEPSCYASLLMLRGFRFRRIFPIVVLHDFTSETYIYSDSGGRIALCCACLIDHHPQSF